jgi:TonB family protein
MKGSLERCLGLALTALFAVTLARGADPSTGGGDDKLIFVSSHTVRETARVKPEPEYPAIARQFRLSGDVVADFVVGSDGRVEKVEITKGHPMLNPAVISAVKRWSFPPYMIDGRPSRFRSTLTFTFHL